MAKSPSPSPISVCKIRGNRGYEREEDLREENGIDNGSGQQLRQREGGVLPQESGSWAGMLPELLGEIIQRVEASDDKWPQHKNVVVCGGVCKKWREATTEIVEKIYVGQPGRITFPSSLKKPSPRDSPIQCLIKRDKKNASFYLYLALSPCKLDFVLHLLKLSGKSGRILPVAS